jgi:hypothetical protein
MTETEWLAGHEPDPLVDHVGTRMSLRKMRLLRCACQAERILQMEAAAQANVLRHFFGNPLRPPQVDPAWLSWNGGTVVNLARAIYADRAFERLPILADALEEAGCTSEDMLAHCRGGLWHVRGGWVLDLLLTKSLPEMPPSTSPPSAAQCSLGKETKGHAVCLTVEKP